MSAISSGNPFDIEVDYGVRWGRWKKTGPRFKCYCSFHLDGEEFSVKDTVYIQASDGPPYIARIEKLREDIGTRKKTMLVQWFFRPCELPKGVPTVDYNEKCKEIFMAAGSEYAKSLVNPACTIRKCKVVCIANGTWNRMPSAEQAAAADHVVHRAFNALKLRLESLDPLQVRSREIPKLIVSGKELQVGSSSRKAGGENGEACADMFPNRIPKLHSQLVSMGKSPRQPCGRQTDVMKKLKSPQRPPSVLTSTLSDALLRVKSGKRPRMDILEGQSTRKATLDGMTNDKGRSVLLSRKQDIRNSEKRVKMQDSKAEEGETKKTHVAALRGEIEKGKLSSQARNGVALPLDRLSKVHMKKFSDREHVISPPLSSSRRAGEDISLARDREPREAAVLAKRFREESYSVVSGKKSLAESSRPDKRAKECCSGSTPILTYASFSQNAGSSLEFKGRDGTLKNDGPKEDSNGANRIQSTAVKPLLKGKLVRKDVEDAQKKHNHSLSSASALLKYQDMLKFKGKGDSALGKNISRPVMKGERIRLISDGENRKLKPKQVMLDGPEGAAGRADVYRIAEGVGYAGDHGRALSAKEDRHNVFTPNQKIFKFPWEEKKSVEEAVTKGRALLLVNLDPCLNSVGIEAILENVLDTTCAVHILPPKTITCYKSAEAVVIFKKAEVAQDVLRTLVENLIVISDDERPVIASLLTKPKQSYNDFHGFFNLEKFGWKMNESVDQKNAVATSHCAQANTVEYETGLHWRLLQDRDTLNWQKLDEEHQRQIGKVKAKYQKFLL